MAITRTLTFTGVHINGVDYSEHLQESAEITIEPVTDLVDDGQTLPSAYDVSFSVDVYDSNLLSEAVVYTDSTASPTKTNIVFTGISGGTNVTVADVIINGNKKYDQNRIAVTLSGTKRAVSLSTAVVEADVS